jgi:outer membrane protein assembly factor BamB
MPPAGRSPACPRWRTGSSTSGPQHNNVYALATATGSLDWFHTTLAPLYSSPAVAHGLGYIGSDHHDLYAFGPAQPG